MSKQLSQAEIDALLSSLRQAQEDADGLGRAPGGATGEGGAGPAAVEPLATALAELVADAWSPHLPGVSIVADAAAPATSTSPPATRVVRLHLPLGGRLWFFWQGGGASAQDAVDAFLAGLTALVPGMAGPEDLSAATPLPPGALLLAFRAAASGEGAPLTLGLHGTDLTRLAACLGGRGEPVHPEGSAAAIPAAGMPIEDLEVEASVYVGGGVYRLSALTSLRPGTVLPLATEVGEPAVIAIAGRVIAYGEVMVTADETLAVRLTRVVLGEEGRRAAPPWLEQARREGGAERPRGATAPPSPRAR